MRFNPVSQEEINSVLKPGVYPFEIIKAIEKTSKNGNEMIELTLKVIADKKCAFVKDFITANADYKLRNFCYSVGMETDYLTGQITELDCMNRAGHVELKIESDINNVYPDKNRVSKYILQEKTEDIPSDEIPF